MDRPGIGREVIVVVWYERPMELGLPLAGGKFELEA
jgi:hypothetical protein